MWFAFKLLFPLKVFLKEKGTQGTKPSAKKILEKKKKTEWRLSESKQDRWKQDEGRTNRRSR